MPELLPDDLILSAHLDAATRSRLYAARRSGTVVRLHNGVYVRSSIWNGLTEQARHRARALAVSVHFGPDLIFSHLTAASLWRLPHVGGWPSRPHVAGDAQTGGRSTEALVRHEMGIPEEPEEIDGLRVTSLARCAVESAAILSFGPALVLADAALRRGARPAELEGALDVISPFHGSARARRAIAFADGRADRPGESLSRASMVLAGVTLPQIQVELLGASGLIYTVDFWWPEFNLIGEFDGKIKYTDPEFLRGKTPADALYDEKLREDDLRAANHGFSRWPWATAMSPVLLKAHLARAGVR